MTHGFIWKEPVGQYKSCLLWLSIEHRDDRASQAPRALSLFKHDLSPQVHIEHTCTHALMHTCAHAHMHTCTHVHTHTRTHAHMHTCTHTHMRTHTHAHHTSSIHSIPTCKGKWLLFFPLDDGIYYCVYITYSVLPYCIFANPAWVARDGDY